MNNNNNNVNNYPRIYGGRPPQAANLNYRARLAIPAPINPPVNAYHPGNVDDDDDEASGPLVIRIQAPLHIRGNNNICATDAANVSQRVSESIASAIRKLAGDAANGGAGIPMIDGRGMPRRIEVQVDVGTRIEGQGNLVGERDVVQMVRTGGARDRQEAQARRGDQNGEGGDARQRQESRSSPARELVVKREPLDEVLIVNGPANPIAPRNGVVNVTGGHSPNPTLSGTGSPSINGTQKSTPKAGNKRKSARIARDDEVASDAGLGITTRPDQPAEDKAAKRPRRG